MEVITESRDINMQEWKEFVFNHPNGNFFQSPDTFNFFKRIPNYSPFIIISYEHSEVIGLLSGVIITEPGIKSFFTKRCIVWGGPLAKQNDKNVINILLSELNNKVKHKTIYSEFRNIFSLDNEKQIFKENGFVYQQHLNIHVPTKDAEAVKKRISKSKIRQIKSSLSQGAKIREPVDIEEIKSFYSILKVLYKTKVKKPLPPLEFFTTFFDHKNLGKYFLIEYNNEIIGGIMCPIYKQQTIYEWYIAGMDNKYTKIYPSVLSTWSPIEFGIKNKLDYFDFLGAGSYNKDYGVRNFKLKFGGEQVEYGRFIRINKPLLYNMGKLGLMILKTPVLI